MKRISLIAYLIAMLAAVISCAENAAVDFSSTGTADGTTFPNHIRRGRGVRCPIKYVYRNLVGEMVGNDKVADAVQRHMEALQIEDKFSDEELVVEVSFPDIQNFIHISFPGFPDVAVENRQTVVHIPDFISVEFKDARQANAQLASTDNSIRPKWRDEEIKVRNFRSSSYFDPAYNVKGGLDDHNNIASKAQGLRDVKHHLEQDLFDDDEF